jgi:hypothetical protein
MGPKIEDRRGVSVVKYAKRLQAKIFQCITPHSCLRMGPQRNGSGRVEVKARIEGRPTLI